MDPLSIIASSLTIFGAASVILSTLNKFQAADSALRDMVDELRNFETILCHTSDTICTYRAYLTVEQWTAVAGLLEHARGLTQELETLMQKLVVAQTQSTRLSVRNRITWTLKSSDTERLKKRLGDLNLNLGALVNAITLRSTLALHDRFEAISEAVKAFAIQQQHFQYAAMSELQQQQEVLRMITQTDQMRITSAATLDRSPLQGRPAFGLPINMAPRLPVDISLKKILSPGLYYSHDYNYLAKSVHSWNQETVPIYIKAMNLSEMPELKLLVRRFRPTATWQGTVGYRCWTEAGWKPMPRVFTEPYGIPYTEYVECRQLESWARESYAHKMRRNQDVAGRALLSAVALQDSLKLSQKKLVNDAFTFAALTWVGWSMQFASNRPMNGSSNEERKTIPVVPSTPDKTALPSETTPKAHKSRWKSLFKRSKTTTALKAPTSTTPPITTSEWIPVQPEGLPYFASDEKDGISTCPVLVNTQLSLLSQERNRALETEILSQFQHLIFTPEISKPTFEDIYAIYIALTLLMDAYESYAMSFECAKPEDARRCVDLVDTLITGFYRLIHDMSMTSFLQQLNTHPNSKVGGGAGDRVLASIMDDENRAFFQRNGWRRLEASGYKDFNFAFQSRLQGCG